MDHTQDVRFGRFRLDRINRQLWDGDQQLALQPKPWAVLCYLLEHADRLVSKEELLQQVWAGTYVTPRALIVCINAIRKVLGDSATAPQYIETMGQAGYRFIGPVRTQRSALSSQPENAEFRDKLPPPLVVGRATELAQLQRSWAQAQRGERQLVFVTGEAGIGKTAVVQHFVNEITAHEAVWVGQGQCIEQYGHGEAYLPVLEALGRIGRLPEGEALVEVLKQSAPSWAVQLPALIPAEELEALQLKIHGTSQDRMLRELIEALEVLTAERALLLVLEDLHWGDVSTLEWLAAVARRQEHARLLIIGTYRPADVIVSQHPLRPLVQELVAHQQCYEVQLELLTEKAVIEYVTQRLGEGTPAELGAEIHQQTDGNALFMVHTLDYLLHEGIVVPQDGQWGGTCYTGNALGEMVPTGLRQLIVKQIERLQADEQQVLAVASLVAAEFTVAALAAGTQQAVVEIEAVCEGLVQHEQFVAADGIVEWPDGTLTARYRFRHALYQQVLQEKIGAARRLRLYRRIGEREEAGYGGRVEEIASKLALYFEAGQVYPKAVQYRQLAAQNALRRSAYREALEHCERGLALLSRLPDSPERRRQELAVRAPLHAALTAVQGYTTDDMEANLQRMRILCQDSGDVKDLVPVLVGLGRLYVVRSARTAAVEILEQETRLVDYVHEPALAIQLHTQLCLLTMLRGEYDRSRAHGGQVFSLYTPEEHASLVFSFGLDPLVNALTFTACSEWLAGCPDESLRLAERGLAQAEQEAYQFSLVFALFEVAMLRLLRREPDPALQLAQRCVAVAHEYGFLQYSIAGSIFQGCALVQTGQLQAGLALITEGLAGYRATRARMMLPLFHAFQIEACLQLGKFEEGLQVVTQALELTATNLDVFWEAELYRLQGELLLAQTSKRQKAKASPEQSRRGKSSQVKINSQPPDPQSEAETCFQQALEVARRQGAKSLELRAAMSLGRLWHGQGKQAAARQLVAETYSWFTEGFETKDLQDAKVLLEELAA